MNAYLFLILIAMALISFAGGISWAGWILVFLIVLDALGNVAITFFKVAGAIGSGLSETGKTEFENVAAAKTKYPSGMKFAEDTAKTLGKEIGKGEKAKKENKKIAKGIKTQDFGTLADKLFGGMQKLLKK